MRATANGYGALLYNLVTAETFEAIDEATGDAAFEKINADYVATYGP